MPSVQIKNVPEDVHRILRTRAAAASQSLQEYLLARLVEEARTEPVSVYDAAYMALAEAIGAPLLTADRSIATVPGLRCEVELVS